ncbi:hypothetical protein HK102_002187 [Quaeritorhiza haematococci]|nr:hypothetical protein HK102_002187 [Quaeritorhiza haematococci]
MKPLLTATLLALLSAPAVLAMAGPDPKVNAGTPADLPAGIFQSRGFAAAVHPISHTGLKMLLRKRNQESGVGEDVPIQVAKGVLVDPAIFDEGDTSVNTDVPVN